jgi:selenide,water dikinase
VHQLRTVVVKDLVLVGGGHSHVAVLRAFGMRRLPGVRLTLISKDASTAYSGMLPGFVAGHYQFEEAHIDLRPLCQFAGAAFYIDSVTGLDLANKRVLCAHRPAVSFDLLSINIGSTPRANDVPGAIKYTSPIKPIECFVKRWEQLAVQARHSGKLKIVIVGGGAGGVELTLAMQYRLQMLLKQREAGSHLEFHIVTAADRILPTHSLAAQRKFERILRERAVHVHLNHRVLAVHERLMHCKPGEPITFDAAFWVTNAAPPPWIAQSGLETDAEGFVALNDCLQSESHPFVFAAGDIAAVKNHPRPKSGVFAVRQGRPLVENLRRALTGKPLQPFAPQKQFLSLISTGNKYAVASRHGWALEGEWVWRWKDWIDRRWMRQYQTLPEMSGAAEVAVVENLAGPETLKELSRVADRCGGCGAKVGSDILARVMQRLSAPERDDVLIGLNSPDDAAVIQVPSGMVSIQTVDFFRAFIDDAYLFGAIAANHSLGDILAMGASPVSAMAMATLPYGLEAKVEEQLYQLMSGAVSVLVEHNTALVGGHTAEGPELAFGLAVHGVADPKRLLRKGGMQAGDRLILTKPLGTGALFAADMRGKTKGKWIQAALTSMLQSNSEASQCFLRYQATACTDVTGFGLLGHLVEMVKASPAHAELSLPNVPLLDGVLEVMRAGIFSSLHPQNFRLRRAIRNAAEVTSEERYPILFDPQTAGGLLASVPGERAESCLLELRRAGYSQAAIVGEVKTPLEDQSPISVKS